MKKTLKSIFFSLALLVMAAVMFLTAACGNGSSVDIAEVTEIVLSGQQTSFEYGERFTAEGLVVTATLDNGGERTLAANEYSLDSSAFDRMQPGVYTVFVTVNGTNISASYSAKVNEREILPAPALENAIYAYNGLDPLFSTRTVNYEPATGQDLDWEGRYKVEVFAPGDEEHSQDVGMVAAYAQMHSQEAGLSSIGAFDFNGTVVVRVQTDFSFERVDIRPLSLGIEYERVDGMDNTIEFTLTRPCNISVEFDGNTIKNLVLFSNYIDSYSMPSDEFIESVKENVGENDNLIIVDPTNEIVDVNDIYAQYSSSKHNIIVFGQGLYTLKDGNGVGGQAEFFLPSDTTMYLHGDAAIYGHLRVNDANNVLIKGCGYISGQHTGPSYNLHINNSRNVVVEDIILYHSFGWTNVLTESQDITYRGVRLAGQRRNNNDGFDMCASSDVLIDNCWIRTIDDCITIKARFGSGDTRMHVENIIVQNTTLWNYQGGNGIVVGSESNTDVYNNLVFRNIDIIHNNANRAIAMEIIDSAHVTNTVFDDIRMELDNEFFYYDNDGDGDGDYKYESDWSNPTKLIGLEIIPTHEAFYGTDTENGIIDGVVFNNIKFVGNPARKIEFSGADAEHKVSNVIFNNFEYNGTMLNDFNYFEHLAASDNYENVRFSTGDYYFEPNESCVLADDLALKFAGGVNTIEIDNPNLTGGTYTQTQVRLGDASAIAFAVSEEGYYMPVVNLKTGLTGGMFDVKFDGKEIGSVNTYSQTSEWMQYYLPMDYITAGEHTITFTARSLPNEKAEGYMLDLGIDYVKFVDRGVNFLELETFASDENVTIGDMTASGGKAVGFELQAGEGKTFCGAGVRARGAQLRLLYQAGPDKGIYKFYFDGGLISEDIDMYAPVIEWRTAVLGTAEIPAEEFTFMAKCVGKNAASTGTNCTLDYIKTVHLPASKTYKSGFGGDYITVSEGVTLSKGMFSPARLGNVTSGAQLTWTLGFPMPADGVYEHLMKMSDGFDGSAFELYINGKKTTFEMKGSVLCFTVPRTLGDTFVIQLKCIGSGVYAFDWTETVIEPVDISKDNLADLVAQEDEHKYSADTEEYLKIAHMQALDAAKSVLFARTSTQRQVDIAFEALQVAASRLEEGKAPYTQTILHGSEVTVFFDYGKTGDLTILYLQSGEETASYYALIGGDGSAMFTVDEKYIDNEVKLYCEVVGDPLAGATIELDGKITSALEFLFDDGYWTVDRTKAYYFESIRDSKQIDVKFAARTVEEGDIVMLSLRNRLDKELAVYYSTIDKDLRASFSIDNLQNNGIYAVLRVANRHDAEVKEIWAEKVLLDQSAIGHDLVFANEKSDINITSTVISDEDGVIRYPVNCGWINNTVTIEFGLDFDYVELDLGILAYCGSGGPDSIFVYSLNDKSLDSITAVNGSVSRKSFTFTAEQCNGGLVLKLWYGCKGDWGPCTHADEEIYLYAVRCYANVSGRESELVLLGGDAVEIPQNVQVYKGMSFDTLMNAELLTAKGDFTVGDEATLTVKSAAGRTVGTYTAICERAGTVIFALDGYAYAGAVSVFVSTEKGNVALTSARADIAEELHLGKMIHDGTKSDSLSVSSGNLVCDEDGVVSYPIGCGWKNSVITLVFNCDFDYVELDLGMLAHCNSGGVESITLFSKDRATRLDAFSSALDAVVQKNFTYTQEQCNGAIVIDMWYGCAGDNAPCLAGHDDEEIYLGTVRIVGSVSGSACELVIAETNIN